MGYKEIVEQSVRRRLADSFGAAVTMLIMASATRAAGVPVMELSREDYLALVEAICGDQRVVDMWGAAGTASAHREWSALAP